MSTIDVIELSSDSESCCSPKLSSKENYDSESTVDIDINNIYTSIKPALDNYKHNPVECISSSSSDTETDNFEYIKQLKLKYCNASEEEKNQYCDNAETRLKTTINFEYEEPKPKKARNKSEDKVQKQLEKEQEKIRKQTEREKKKAETAKAKAEKQQLASLHKALKPNECIKFITASIDSDLLSMEYSSDITNTLQTANISYKVTSNVIPYSVIWNRKIQAQLSSLNGELNLEINRNDEHCDEVLLILLWKDIVRLIHENKLCNDIKFKQSLLKNKKIHLGIYGIKNYFRFHKSQNQKISGKDKIYVGTPNVSRKDIIMALTEIQLLFNISHRFLETTQDVSAIVLQFTKSIAQIPYKLQKGLNDMKMNMYISGFNKNCVRVDKNGNGLHRLWQQHLTQFNLVRLETAEAITSKYPTFSALYKAYEECSTVEEAEKLLQDIPVRRAAGPLTSVRKIGPELSKKMYTLFTSIDGNTNN